MSRSKAEYFSGHEATSAFRDGVLSGGRARLRRVVGTLRLWADRSRQRRVLAGMDERRLRDIGRTHAEAQRETRKWFWEP